MVLVTGGSGFVGRALVPALLGGGHVVRVLARNADRIERQTGVEVASGDLLDVPSLERALKGVTAVVHLAAAHDSSAPPILVRNVNIAGTANLARAAAREPIQRFVYCSTAGVYGDRQSLSACDESMPPSPVSLYHHTKLQGELAVSAELSKAPVSWIVLRPPALHGPGRHSSARFFRQLQKRPMWIHTPTTVILSPTYVGDLVSAIFMALERREISGETINVAGPRVLTYREFIEFVARRLGSRVYQLQVRAGVVHPVARMAIAAVRLCGATPNPALERLAHPIVNRSLDISKARRLLGFEPHALEYGIDETIAWARREGLLEDCRPGP